MSSFRVYDSIQQLAHCEISELLEAAEQAVALGDADTVEILKALVALRMKKLRHRT